MTNNSEIIVELQRIARQSNGVLIPERVVEEARSESSVLHDQFCWNDDEAARRYRIWQARDLIRTTIHWIQINGDARPVRAFVSLKPDRQMDGGGYRDVVAVIADKDMRRQMLEDALDELRGFEQKYAHLKELTEVFVASRRARQALLELVA